MKQIALMGLMAAVVVWTGVHCDSGGESTTAGNGAGPLETGHPFDGNVLPDAGSMDTGVPDAGADTGCIYPNTGLQCPQDQMVTDRSGELKFGFSNTSSAELFLAAFSLDSNGPDSVNIQLHEIPMFVGSVCSCPTASCGRWCGPAGYCESAPVKVTAGTKIVSTNIGNYGYRSVICKFGCFECRTNTCDQPVAIPSGQYHASFCLSCTYLAPSDECYQWGLQFCPKGYIEVKKELVVLPSDTTVYVDISDSDLPVGCAVPHVDGGLDAGPDGGTPDASPDASLVAQCDDGGYCHDPGVFSCGSLMIRPRPDQACATDGGQTGFCCEPCYIPPDAGWVDNCTIVGGACTPLDLGCAQGFHESPQACEHCSPGRCCIPDTLPPCNPGEEYPLYCNGKKVPWCTCVQPGTWQCREHPGQDC